MNVSLTVFILLSIGSVVHADRGGGSVVSDDRSCPALVPLSGQLRWDGNLSGSDSGNPASLALPHNEGVHNHYNELLFETNTLGDISIIWSYYVSYFSFWPCMDCQDHCKNNYGLFSVLRYKISLLTCPVLLSLFWNVCLVICNTNSEVIDKCLVFCMCGLMLFLPVCKGERSSSQSCSGSRDRWHLSDLSGWF